MKLYYSPGACSLAPHIVASEAGLPVSLAKVDLKTKTLEDGSNYIDVNCKGYVPALQIADGPLLTEVSAIVQYLADQKPETGLAPPPGSIERYQLVEWLNYIATEFHKTIGFLFRPNLTEAARQAQIDLIHQRLGVLDQQLTGKVWLLGDTFTAADAYLFTVLGWANFLKLDLSRFEHVNAYKNRAFARPAVQQAMRAEGLIA